MIKTSDIFQTICLTMLADMNLVEYIAKQFHGS